MSYFKEQKAKAQALQAQIDRTDKEIDRMVYALYGLTEEEVAVVEGREVKFGYLNKICLPLYQHAHPASRKISALRVSFFYPYIW